MIDAHPHELRNGIDPVVGSVLDVVQELIYRHMLRVKLVHMDVVLSVLERSDSLEEAFFKRSSDAHYLSGRLHLGRKNI